MRKFQIGDRVRNIYTGWQGQIVGTWDCKGYTVCYDENEDDEYYVLDNEIEFVNLKEAFLTRLQELLATFDASIVAAGEGSDSATIDIYSGKHLIYMADWNDDEFVCKITAENIFDYDKG